MKKPELINALAVCPKLTKVVTGHSPTRVMMAARTVLTERSAAIQEVLKPWTAASLCSSQ